MVHSCLYIHEYDVVFLYSTCSQNIRNDVPDQAEWVINGAAGHYLPNLFCKVFVKPV